MMAYKRPISVLVVIHTPDLHVLLVERTVHPGYWQSVTGSQEDDETLINTARREVHEETGILAPEDHFQDWHLANRFEILDLWRDRYAPDVTHNTEHVFSLCIAEQSSIRLASDEHRDFRWLPWQEAARLCFSWSNQDAILMLPLRPAISLQSGLPTA